jgi:hypothetical protein
VTVRTNAKGVGPAGTSSHFATRHEALASRSDRLVIARPMNAVLATDMMNHQLDALWGVSARVQETGIDPGNYVVRPCEDNEVGWRSLG